jgi:tetratricopeptide (TPR) repeat protein
MAIAAAERLQGQSQKAYETVRDSFRSLGYFDHQNEDENAKALYVIFAGLTRMGDTDTARARVREFFKDRNERFRKLSYLLSIGTAQAKEGDIDGAQETVDQIISEWEIALRIGPMAILFAELGVAHAKNGEKNHAQKNFTQATRIAQGIEEISHASEVFGKIAVRQALAELGDEAISTSARILMNRSNHLRKIAKVLADRKDWAHFKSLLSPCSFELASAYDLCGLLAQLFSEQGENLADIVCG